MGKLTLKKVLRVQDTERLALAERFVLQARTERGRHYRLGQLWNAGWVICGGSLERVETVRARHG